MDENYKAHIIQFSQGYKEHIERNTYIDRERNLNLLHQCIEALVGEKPLTDEIILNFYVKGVSDVYNFFEAIILFNSTRNKNFADPWEFTNPLIQKLLVNIKDPNGERRLFVIDKYIAKKFTEDPNLDQDAFLQLLHKQGFTDDEILKIVMYSADRAIYMNYPGVREGKLSDSLALTKFGKHLMQLMQPQRGFLGIKKENTIKKQIDNLLLHGTYCRECRKLEWLVFQYENFREGLEGQYAEFLVCKDWRGEVSINYDCINYLIEKDAEKFDLLIQKIVAGLEKQIENRVSTLMSINLKLKGRYHEKIVALSEDYLKSVFFNAPPKYIYDKGLRRFGPWCIAYSKYLLTKDSGLGKEQINRLLSDSTFLLPGYYKFVDHEFGAEVLPQLVDQLFKDSGKNDHFVTLFAIFSKYDIRFYFDRILDFMINHSNAKTRNQAAVLLANYPEEIFPIAEKLIKEKTVNQRIAGAQILAELNTDEATALLNDAVDQESNDDTRNIMLESLAEKRFASPYPFSVVKEMIAKAESRKKLSRWGEKWIEEEKLPKLFWMDKKAELSSNEVRFLIYRMKQAKGLSSDIEARQMIPYIDKSSSTAFAKAMLVAFQNSNADSKLKYYLCIAGMLGGDEMTFLLNSLFRKSIADKRVKMAEYAIGALAMVGTSKALRSIEVIYRKFANKKPAISAVAKEALTAAATELNISMNELADRIIPDFDFEGLYKHFEVDGDEYRAFVNADFCLSFINEDNKIRKSVPPNTAKELKSEFKEIEKEIRDVVKSQSGRLEKYMLDERRWMAVDWHNFFFMNPILFVYAMKLVWGVFDENNCLEQVFYCTEDATLYDLNDDEVAVPSDRFVGILHPAHLGSSNRKLWFDKVFDMQLATIFPIFERTVFTVADDEKELGHSKQFFNQDVPKGADFVNTFLVKKNWLKTPGDGARSNFSKLFKDGEIIAYANIEGPLVVYTGGNTKATVFEISFATVKEKRHEKVMLKDVPPIFYSEVMFDIDQLIKAE